MGVSTVFSHRQGGIFCHITIFGGGHFNFYNNFDMNYLLINKNKIKRISKSSRKDNNTLSRDILKRFSLFVWLV